MNELSGQHLVKNFGDDPLKTLHLSFVLKEFSTKSHYMAFGTKTSDKTAKRLKMALGVVKQNLKFNDIMKKYFP